MDGTGTPDTLSKAVVTGVTEAIDVMDLTGSGDFICFNTSLQLSEIIPAFWKPE
jgi:hypothetical protein